MLFGAKMMEGFGIKDDGYVGPVTSLQFYNEYLLAGQGPNILVFDTKMNSMVYKEQMLFPAVVHGIQIEKRTTCVFGQKSCRVLQISGEEDYMLRLDKLTDVCELEDWIWDVAWVSNGKSTLTLALALGHNVVLHWDWQRNTILHRVKCEEKCILYSARFIGHTWSDLVLAAGTVFNQVVLWPVCGQQNKEGHQKVIHRLSGHEGVIFSIAFSYHNMCLCSVSDDRSIRIWQLCVIPEGQTDGRLSLNSEGPTGAAVDQNSKRCTDGNLTMPGHFRKKEIPMDVWCRMQYELKHVMYGHSARVWDVKLLRELLVTVGEDSTCLVWNYEGQVLQKFKGHKGKSIWSLAVNETDSLVATGGGDCSVRLWHLASVSSSTTNAITSHPVTVSSELKEEDFPRSVALLDDNVVLIMTNEGKLLCHTSGSGSTVWMQDSRYRSYSLLSVSPNKTLVAVGNIHGDVKIFHVDGNRIVCQEAEYHVYEGKVMSILWLDQCTHFITSGPSGALTLWEVTPSSTNIRYAAVEHFILPSCKQRWISAAAVLWDSCILVCGDRGGSVHVYPMKNTEPEAFPAQSFAKLHGKAGVTDVCIHADYVYTSGRDGQYRQFRVRAGQLELMTSSKVFKGFEWIDRMIFQDQNMIILGFHTSKFVVWSLNHNQKLLEVECGGGHRTWDFDLGRERCTFVYLKAKEVVMCKGAIKLEEPILLPSLHGRELTSVLHLFSYKDKHICATSSEDTMVNIIQLSSPGTTICSDLNMTVLKTLQGHLSSVRTLTSVRSSHLAGNITQSRLLFSGGGRAQVKCWKITVSKRESCADCQLSSAVVSTVSGSNMPCPKCAKNKKVADFSQSADDCEVECSIELVFSHMLDEKGKRKRKSQINSCVSSNPETRFMSLTAFRAGDICSDFQEDVVFIAAACSDGLVRLFAFHETNKSFIVLAESTFHDHCVLYIGHLLIQFNSTSEVVIYSGATDGKIAFFNVSKMVKEYVAKCVHVNFEENQLKSEHRAKQTTNLSYISCTEEDGVIPDYLRKQFARTNEYYDLPASIEEPFLVLPLHQSGISAVDVQFIKAGEYMVASGGDDNALHVTHIRLWRNQQDDNISGEEVMRVSMATAHAAQITCVHFLDSTHVLTVSIDQRMVIWTLQAETFQFNMLAARYVSVSDVASMDIWNKSEKSCSAAVVGVGIQLFDVSWR
ncbi:WD repeat-containing protein 6 [Lingula anatina]|uniref:tRNA (34-2'-O)-methyltransferase regulator WDR6 n=1 Tax=Lingula anatina TaxID=7574 RepID=A0A1S3IYL4_LINAN|nr:WD repeat-containing protein 6 [Lingula anatina]|eukprot:XP_013403103.1 WD repeat-containing protein 6 [Lingula anatina]